MGDHASRWWQADDVYGPRRDRRSGLYEVYLADLLAERPLTVSPELARKCSDAERAVRAACSGADSRALEGVARFLLRSEAIASSMIEGIAPSPQQVALAELAQEESVRGFSDQARLVANNITIVRRASSDLASAENVTIEDVEALQAALLTDERHHGLRVVQNWIGGSRWHPLDADFVPPPAEHVRPLMEDLTSYLGASAHAPLVQAAVMHAQFETIHPFTDGNGRVGRALIHTVLTRRGLSPRGVLPVSLVLSTLRRRYVEGLSAYRYVGEPTGPEATGGISVWLDTFMDAALVAAEQATRLAEDVAALRSEWAQRIAVHRTAQGVRPVPRADSATARILDVLTEVPVMTTATARRILDISFPPARAALEELAEAGVLRRRQVDRGSTGYLADDVLDLVGQAERRLASTQFDTRTSAPNRPVPARVDRD